MEQRILWPELHDEDPTPFTSGPKQRPLRITLHSAALRSAANQNRAALSMLRELSEEPELDVYEFEGDDFPTIHVDPQPTRDHHRVIVRNRARQPIIDHIGVHNSRISELAVHSAFDLQPYDESFPNARGELLEAEAHGALHRDILVTLSPLLLKRRKDLEHLNPMSPVEGSRLAGLVLRTRSNWLFRRTGRTRVTTDRGMFYWVLMRTKLPSFWRYFSAVLASRDSHGERLARIAQSALERCFRAIQARDEIAVQFYLPQSNNTSDEMMYHFHYLTVLLAGAFDAIAAVANSVYSLDLEPYYHSFRRPRFIDALREHNCTALLDLIELPETQHLMTMLHKMRNTVHSAGLGTLAYQVPAQPQLSYARAPDGFRDELVQAADDLGGAEQWGIWRDDFVAVDRDGSRHREYDVLVEPFSYAAQLVDQWLPLLDRFASATEVDLLLQEPLPRSLPDEVPADWSDMVPYFVLLGR